MTPVRHAVHQGQQLGHVVAVGRDESASPATGSFKLHQIEEQELVTQALGARPQTAGAVTQPGTVATATQQTATSG